MSEQTHMTRPADDREVQKMEREQADFLARVLSERRRQDKKWGRNFVPIDRMFVVLLEEVGEAARAQLEGDHEHAITELVECAAVCSKMAELIRAGAR